MVALALARRTARTLSRRLAHPKSEVVLLSVMGLLLIAGGVAELARVSGGVVAFLVGPVDLGIDRANAPASCSARCAICSRRSSSCRSGFMVDETAIPGVLGRGRRCCGRDGGDEDGDRAGWRCAATSGVPGRLRAGTALVARGEFSIVIAGLAVAAGGVERRLAPLAAVYVLLTAVSAPLLTRYAGDVALRLRRPSRRLSRSRG